MVQMIEAATRTNRRVAWPIQNWPPVDRVAWEQAQRSGDFLDEPGAAFGWRPATHRAAIGAYGRWLAFLHDNGMLEFDHPPEARFTEPATRAYIVHLRANCSSTTVASYLGVLGMMLQAMVPGQPWAWLWRVQSRLQRQAKPIRNKRARLVPVEDLLRLGQDLMRLADVDPSGAPLTAALTFRDGLMIALLALRPLRRLNIMAIELGQNLVKVSAGYQLCFSEDETKTHRALDIPFPAQLLADLARYLNHHRPVLLARHLPGDTGGPNGSPPTCHLWLTRYGEPFSPKSSVGSLEKHMTARFGHDVNTHLFRDCAATSVANEDPEHTRIGALILGHQTLQTTERHYILANGRSASAGYHDKILSMRAGGPRQDDHRTSVNSATQLPSTRHDARKAISSPRWKD